MKSKLDLLNDPTNKVFWNYLLPSVGGMLGISIYVLGDTLLVGRGLGSSGLAALNISIPIMNIFSGLGFLFGVGGATTVSILRGENKDKETHKVFTLSFVVSLIIGVLLTIFGLLYLKEFSTLMGANSDMLLNMSTAYLRPMFVASIPFVLNSFMIIFLRNDHAPRLVMIAMLTSSISNIILDYIFIFPLDMGMYGAGLATAMSPVISLIILSTHFIRKNNMIKFSTFKFKFNTSKRIVSNGTPSFVIETMAGVVIFVFNIAILNIKGDIGVSAYSIVANLSLFCAAVFNGIGQAIQPLVSVNYGAEKYKRKKKFVKLAIYTALGFSLFFFIIGLLFPVQLTNVFIDGNNPKLMKISVVGIRLYFISFIFMGLNTVLISYMQSMEYATESITISVIRGFILVMVGIFIWPSFWGINGVWLTIPIAEILTFIYITLFNKSGKKIVAYSLKRN